MSSSSFQTQCGVEVRFAAQELELESALGPVTHAIDTHRGAIFSSGFDYPGRHSRWDIGFVNPALCFSAKARSFCLEALNEQGAAVLDIFEGPLQKNTHVEQLERKPRTLRGTIRPRPAFFPEEERSKQPSIFSVLRTMNSCLLSLSPLASHFGLYGAFGYDLVLQFEEITLKHDRTDGVPDCCLFLPLELVVVDRKRESAKRVTYSLKTPRGWSGELTGGGSEYTCVTGRGPGVVVSDHQPGEFAGKVAKVIEGTKRGDYFEVVLSQSFSKPVDVPPTAVFRRLAQLNPSPYMFLINLGNEQLIGASPEIYVRVTGDRYETCPIAGTIERGSSALEDADQALLLLASQKDESELTMCTDVDRNDMARVCVPGSVKVIGRRQLEFYSHLIHTVDHLEGRLAPQFDALDAFQTHMWACTVTGAPKPAALQEIENLESSPRGWYSGAVGFLSFDGNINTGITLRTANIKNGTAVIRAGATLLYDSEPEKEEHETRTKAAGFLAALSSVEKAASAHIEDVQIAKAAPVDGTRVLLVDYQDSFVHNLAAYLQQLGARVTTLRHGFPIEELERINPDLVFLSPGPATPEEFGVPSFVGLLTEKRFPIFGVCLGHQGIGQHFGATLAQLPVPVHGKAATVEHFNSPLFDGIDTQFEAGRYHSLYLKDEGFPAELEITARSIGIETDSSQGVIMGIRHRTLPVAAVQFHPESLMTLKKQAGHLLLANAINQLTAGKHD